jgi:hypothetical protein
MKLNKKDVFRILASLFAFILVVVLFVVEIPYHSNTFNSLTVILISIFIGIVAGVLLALYLRKYADELFAKFQLFVSLAIVGAFIFPALISMVNRIHVTESDEELIYIETNEVYGMVFKGAQLDNGEISPTSFEVILERENGTREAIRFSDEISADWETGQVADITVLRGVFNIHFVYPE